MENDTLLIEDLDADFQDVFINFIEDGVAQESNETFTLALEPTFSTLENLPKGEAAFFIRFINVTIVDSDRKLSRILTCKIC